MLRVRNPGHSHRWSVESLLSDTLPLVSDAGDLDPTDAVGGLPSERSGTRLGIAALLYMVGVTLIITLLPFQFSWPDQWRVMTTGNAIDVAANVLLFVPLGVLFRIATGLSRRHAVMGALAAGVLVSMVIEALQLFEAERYSSVLDVAANGLGALIGAIVCDRAFRRQRPDVTVIGRLFLELPLMGLLYLTFPLIWLTALVSVAAPQWAWLSIPLAAFGGSLLGGVLHHVRSAVPPQRAGAFAAAAIVIGMLPALSRAPLAIAIGASVAFLTTRLVATRQERSPMWNRRFEVPVLRASAPFYAMFLVLMVALSLADGVAPWSLGAGFPGTAQSWDKVEILRFLVRVAAFTLLGYMIAEYRGREEQRLANAVPRVLRWTVAAATAAEIALGYRAGRGASVAQWGFVISAALYGGWLYRLQLEHVIAVSRETRDPRPIPRDL